MADGGEVADVLSEIHFGCQPDPSTSLSTYQGSNLSPFLLLPSSQITGGTSRFEFWRPQDSSSSDDDSDGEDLTPPRAPAPRDFLLLRHGLETRLADVGLQVWGGALLLGDWALSQSWKDARVVELGCGVGLSSLAWAMSGATVLATDCQPEALRLLRANAEANRGHLTGRLETGVLDWRRLESLSESLKAKIADCQVICAADGWRAQSHISASICNSLPVLSCLR